MIQVERERSLLNSKLIEFENLLRNPYVNPPNTSSSGSPATATPFPVTNFNAPSLGVQNNMPIPVSSFSQLGSINSVYNIRQDSFQRTISHHFRSPWRLQIIFITDDVTRVLGLTIKNEKNERERVREMSIAFTDSFQDSFGRPLAPSNSAIGPPTPSPFQISSQAPGGFGISGSTVGNSGAQFIPNHNFRDCS